MSSADSTTLNMKNSNLETHPPISLFKKWFDRLAMIIAIVGAMVIGGTLGSVFGPTAAGLSGLTDIFMWLIKGLTPYLIFLSITTGVLSVGSLERLKSLGVKAGCLYLGTAVFAVVIGIFFANIFQPGLGFITPPPTPLAEISFLKNLLNSHLLQIVVVSLLLSVATLFLKDSCKKKIDSGACNKEDVKTLQAIIYTENALKGAAKILFKGIGWIVLMAPLAVLGAMAKMFATDGGLSTLSSYVGLVLALLSSVGIQFCILGAFLFFIGKLNPLYFFKKMAAVMLMAFATSSSKATLPFAMEHLRTKMGASEHGSNFILPLGAAINMDGTAIYLGIISLFFAQAYGIELSLTQYLILTMVATVGSIGAAGIPGGSLIFMPMVFGAVGIPADGIAMILAIDRILDMVRTMTNVTGDCALALTLDASEGGVDKQLYARAV
jgi:hypothetical protein